ncbi:hypothetical protein DM01DRAFT_1331327 [Hesseltinella vesiculosa]|uniref:TOG domain-containing protein n=1 Tax=Hesseltinella vesiculosa TaxID=101127 RepID=A0A1X2GUY4_9FUNG|nr:hypothetical protein DM01DRAFT_1331327 [Hesseltinella vesiculosa]
MTIQPLAFEVAHCSSWDDNHTPDELVNFNPGNQDAFNEQELANVKIKGWQTPKCPTYPQDLIIHLTCGPARIGKIQLLSHHYKIATKIDVYIGILKEPTEDMSLPSDDDEDDTLIEFTRLGYVCFDSNARAQFRARELKSIKINADGEYIRLVVRQCHQNRLNTYNQVGLLALNVLGQAFSLGQSHGHQLPTSLDGSSMLSSSTRRTSVSSTHSLSHGMSAASVVEMELQHWTSALVHAEELAVQDEAYGKAKTYKSISDKLAQFTKILIDLEQSKRLAVDTKDYDEAEKIKQDISEIKLTAESILKTAHIRVNGDGMVEEIQPSQEESEATPSTALETDRMYEETIAKWTNFDVSSNDQPEMSSSRELEEILMPPNLMSYDQPMALSASVSAKLEKKKHHDPSSLTQLDEAEDELLELVVTEEEQQPEEPVDPDLVPEAIMEEERGMYHDALALFGEEPVAFVLSIKIKCRERGLRLVQQKIDHAYHQAPKTKADMWLAQFVHADALDTDDPAACFVSAVLMLLQEAIMDSREALVLLTIQLWQQLNDLYVDNQVSAKECWEWTRRAFNGLLKRTGDANLTIRSHAVDLVLLLAHTHASPASFNLVPLFISKPERLIHAHKEAVARIDLVHRVLKELKCKPQGIVDPEECVAFAKAYSQHSHDEVKKQAIQLLVTLATDMDHKRLNAMLDKDLQMQLQTALGGSKTHLVSNKDEAMAELRAMSVKQVTKRSEFNNTKRRADAQKSTASAATKKRVTATTSTRAAATKSTRAPQQQPEPAASKEDSVCIFCDEQNDTFNEKTLISHYYKTCPALTTCSMCQTIVEVSSLQSHMLTDCEKRHLLKQCTRCKQAIPVEQWLQHTLKNTCQAYTNDTRCPLCQTVIQPANDQGWRRHLLSGQGCPKNTRPLKDTKAAASSNTPTKKPTSTRAKPSSLRKKN